MKKISVCIATYRRADRLDALLADLSQQRRLPDELVIVDNDPNESARRIVDRHAAAGLPFPIRYSVQPQKNISLTRNQTVALAGGDWLAFIDDDERAPAPWLALLLEAAARFDADAVLGPVDPVLPAGAPAWIRRGRFYDFPRMTTGAVIPPNRLRFGNVLIQGSWLRGLQQPFDPAYGLTGGEDGDLLSRLAQAGAKIIWSDEAIVHEPVEQSRLSLRWLLRRALSGGQDFARHSLAGRYGTMSGLDRTLFLLKALLQAFAALVLALVCWPAGRHIAARWLTKVAANVGKLSTFIGWQYREYG
jgi:succinoglycan biosynthesis protein ExoM